MLPPCPLLIRHRCHAACTLQVVVHKFREVIAATPYLRNRSIELQAAVAPLLRPVFMEQGESVFAEGMAPDAMYVLGEERRREKAQANSDMMHVLLQADTFWREGASCCTRTTLPFVFIAEVR